MFKVALYGGAGSGKSTAANLFASHGTAVIDADDVAADLTVPGSPLLAQIVAAFGSKIIRHDHRAGLDRDLLRRIIFSNKAARGRLNDIMHPPIRVELEKRIKDIEASYCIVVVPLLIETRMTDLVDYIVVIDCPEQTQIERIIARDGLSYGEAVKIISVQATRKRRLEVSDTVIDNNGDLNHLKEQVDKLHTEWI